MKDRDARPLAEIRFARGAEEQIRIVLEAVGVVTGQDIVEMGCTGLFERVQAFVGDIVEARLGAAQYIRRRMSGSICGLPCYVPRDRYCLVHDTIGGLQAAGNLDGTQAIHHPEALSYMSRELTEEEHRKVFGVEKKINEEARRTALAEYGAEDIEAPPDFNHLDGLDASSSGGVCPIPQPPFKCPDHAEPDWMCRKCIAQVLVEGGDVRAREVRGYNGVGWDSNISVERALERLHEGDHVRVELWVRVASWSKKVTRG